MFASRSDIPELLKAETALLYKCEINNMLTRLVKQLT